MTLKYIIIIVVLLLIVFLTIRLYISYHPVFGGKAQGVELDRIINSVNYKDGVFVNLEPTVVMSEESGSMLGTMWEWIVGPENGKPEQLTTKPFNKSEFNQVTDSTFNLTWFGHSSVLLNVGNQNILIDPVFSSYASPVPGTNRSFNYSNNYSADEMPDIDVLVISHDHYDHLDKATIEDIDSKVTQYVVPLGIKAHLTHWGIDGDKITEADWWDEILINDNLMLAATPARHFSGRGIARNTTLWCSWVISSDKGNVFFGGDSGYGSHFKTIGEKYGPFKLTMIECGQYNKRWKSIHAMPEESVQANIDLHGELMLPIHNSKYQLALHAWTEPIERARKASQKKGVKLLEPVIGEVVEIHYKQ